MSLIIAHTCLSNSGPAHRQAGICTVKICRICVICVLFFHGTLMTQILRIFADNLSPPLSITQLRNHASSHYPCPPGEDPARGQAGLYRSVPARLAQGPRVVRRGSIAQSLPASHRPCAWSGGALSSRPLLPLRILCVNQITDKFFYTELHRVLRSVTVYQPHSV